MHMYIDTHMDTHMHMYAYMYMHMHMHVSGSTNLTITVPPEKMIFSIIISMNARLL